MQRVEKSTRYLQLLDSLCERKDDITHDLAYSKLLQDKMGGERGGEATRKREKKLGYIL